ncbi:hypothetical protein MMC25_006641 [Agyrium rufum]|nr:hypothetical protein [Agyrium rufum]
MDVKKIAIIGAGSMGSMMSLLFADHGFNVTILDPSEENVKAALRNAERVKQTDRIHATTDYADMCKGLGSPKIFLLSLPHGSIPDLVLDNLHPYLEPGDIVIDGSNEHYASTQKRQGRLMAMGAHFIGMGVSGGYQSARSGPSMSPGGDSVILKQLMPMLEEVAAKDPQGRPCVARIGQGGSGHYTKMVHNGIEQGMMSALCETWGMMYTGLKMSFAEIGDVFEKWSADGELKGNFLTTIGINISRTINPDEHKPELSDVKDKVVQDVDETEGTGVWTVEEGARLHVPIPTIAAAHLFRIASANEEQRQTTSRILGGRISPFETIEVKSKKDFIEDLRVATYAAFLASFVQGLHLLYKANVENKWGIDFLAVAKIWQAGCIIRSDYISGLLEPLYSENPGAQLLEERKIMQEFKRTYPALKRINLAGVQHDLIIPSLSATLEYLKYITTADDLPTQFMEAELDLFGKHMFDLKSDAPGEPITGKHHYEWLPAKGLASR